MTEDVRYIGDLTRLKLEPGDRFVLSSDDRLSDQHVARIVEMWERFAPGTPILVLERGLRLGVVNAAEA